MTRLWPRVALTIGALIPYWQFLTLNVVFVTDDIFASDIFNGELPARALVGRALRAGEWPAWTTELCSGLPLAGAAADPLGLMLFALLPTAPALDLYVITLLLVAAHGSYTLARRLGADTVAAILAGLAFAGSGYFAAQLKHLSITSTVVWLPLGLALIDAAMAPGTPTARRSARAALFALVFSQQVLAGFPQSAYICALVYGAFALFLAARDYRVTPRRALGPMAWLAAAVMLGAAAGAIVMLPLSELAAVTDRAQARGYDWATAPAYWPPNLLQFIVPYVHGDVSNGTYLGNYSLFWEDYGYVGILTFVLAIFGGVREWRRSIVKFLVITTVTAMFFVLGRATLVYMVAYFALPGLSTFRFPTRFLIVVELGLALLAAIGLTRARQQLAQQRGERVASLASLAICLATVADLTFHQPRQNAVVPAAAWLAPPSTASAIRADTMDARTFTPRHRDLHRDAFHRARGWSDVRPYFELRSLLEPNTGAGLWDVASVDCYAGISARWTVDVWGDHNRDSSLASQIATLDIASRRLTFHPAFGNVMRTFGVTHVLSPFPLNGDRLTLMHQEPDALIYRVEGATRARFVRSARAVASVEAASSALLNPRFDPDREVLLHDAAVLEEADASEGAAPGSARITSEGSTSIEVTVDAPAGGYLLLADSFYPGWSATIDGAPAPIVRANIFGRAVATPAGRHHIRMTYQQPGLAAGRAISLAAVVIIAGWLAASLYAARRDFSNPIAP